MAGITAFGQLAATAKPLLAETIPLLNDPSYAAFVVPAVQGIGLQGEEQILALTNAFNLRYFVTDMHVLAALGSATVTISRPRWAGVCARAAEGRSTAMTSAKRTSQRNRKI